MSVSDKTKLDSTNTPSSEWFLATTKPKQEFRAVENLKNQNIHVHCPSLQTEKTAQSKVFVVE